MDAQHAGTVCEIFSYNPVHGIIANTAPPTYISLVMVQVAGLDVDQFDWNFELLETWLAGLLCRCGEIRTWFQYTDRRTPSRPMITVGFANIEQAERARGLNGHPYGPGGSSQSAYFKTLGGSSESVYFNTLRVTSRTFKEDNVARVPSGAGVPSSASATTAQRVLEQVRRSCGGALPAIDLTMPRSVAADVLHFDNIGIPQRLPWLAYRLTRPSRRAAPPTAGSSATSPSSFGPAQLSAVASATGFNPLPVAPAVFGPAPVSATASRTGPANLPVGLFSNAHNLRWVSQEYAEWSTPNLDDPAKNPARHWAAQTFGVGSSHEVPSIRSQIQDINASTSTAVNQIASRFPPHETPAIVVDSRRRRELALAHRRTTGEQPYWGLGYENLEAETPLPFGQDRVDLVLHRLGRTKAGATPTTLYRALATSLDWTEAAVRLALSNTVAENPAIFELVDPALVDLVAAAYICNGLLVVSSRCRMFVAGVPFANDFDVERQNPRGAVVLAYDGFCHYRPTTRVATQT